MLTGIFLTSVVAVIIYIRVEPQLPSIETLRDVRLQEPLRIYSRDRRLLAEFGEKRRTPVTIDAVPPLLVKAFLAAEDDRFFSHSGVDFAGLARAAIELVRTGQKRQGGSTITMQVARNYFLSSEKTYLRKLTEILLAFRIERSLGKDEILELYFNKIYLGQRAYGVQAAARTYYGQDIDELSVARMAMIAALPKAPSRVNPVTNPEAALERRNYVLGRMHQLDYIDDATFEAAVTEPDDARLHKVDAVASAPYAAEMVREEMVARYGPDAYTSGLEVITTIVPEFQTAANRALRKDLQEYTQRHGYFGPEARIMLDTTDPERRIELLGDYALIGDLQAAVVTALDEQTAELSLADGTGVTLPWEGMSWARAYKSVNQLGPEPKQSADILTPGDIVRVHQDEEGNWRLGQVPRVGGALVSLRPQDGAIEALVGGYDFKQSKFNRVTQARRQPGSSFKPIIYSAALEKGFTPASMINDAPVVFDDPNLEATWRPENYSGKFYGPTRLREALYRSRNLVSIRILRSIGADYAAGYAERFGFSADELPHDLTLALGSASVTPLQMARAYAVLANGGYLIQPYLIHSIQDADGNVLFTARPLVSCTDCEVARQLVAIQDEAADSEAEPEPEPLPQAERVLSPENVWLMTSMMRDVIQRGTGVRAKVLGRSDLAGKTGTTNDQMDGWFSGFNDRFVATAWVGFDTPAPLGRGETGGRSALPMWIDYMAVVLKGVPESSHKPPDGMVTVRIDPATGLLATGGQSGAVFETFRQENVPRKASRSAASGMSGTDEVIDEQLF
ncbi:MAG: penicillin-binding protein 1A [Thiohalobacterales bacterium]|nr:penicillin-binding protein 1A [Thiohalobacterales bacterium]